MLIADIAMLLLISFVSWRGYRDRQTWFRLIPHLIWTRCQGRSFLMQLLIFGPVIVGWLLLCHFVSTHGWQATAAGGMLFGMALALEALRSAEERQKRK